MKDIVTKIADYDVSGAEVVKFEGNDNLIGNVITILNVIIGLLSLVCVVVIIIGGITYMTSSGETTKVTKGKNTILYGIIGLVICILAFAIVNFVIANVTTAS